MDLATLLGIFIALLCIVTGNLLEGGDPTDILLPSPFVIVVPTTFMVALAGGRLTDVKNIIAATKAAYASKHHDPSESVETMVRFAEKARREGLLALEEAAQDVKDPFLRKGVQLAVDGTDPEQLRDILEAEITARKKQGKIPAKFYTDAGGYAPTIGIIGTVLGLVHVLQNLSDPGSLGPAISAAFIATLLGVGSANIFYLPLAQKIKRITEDEVHHMEAVVEGIVAIQSGSNPRVVHQKLTAFLGITESQPAGRRAA